MPEFQNEPGLHSYCPLAQKTCDRIYFEGTENVIYEQCSFLLDDELGRKVLTAQDGKDPGPVKTCVFFANHRSADLSAYNTGQILSILQGKNSGTV